MGRATNFENCYIYHILDKEKVVHYVGSTSNFNSRKSKHRYCCSHEKCKEYNFDIYKYIRDHGGFYNFDIIPIRKLENISNKTDLLIAEREEMEKFTGLKNMIGSYSTKEEHLEKIRQWRENNPEKNSEYCKKWREANKEKINEYQRQRYHEKKQLKAEDQ
jgi:hypothetical protein